MSLGLNFTDFEYDKLFTSDFPVNTKSIVLVAGAGVLVRGSVLGKITASGKYKLSLAAAVDGSEVPQTILADDSVDASSADKRCTGYESGGFNEDELTFGTGHTADSVRDAFRAISIFLKKAVSS